MQFTVIAGPCTIEGREMIEDTAKLLAKYPNAILKGGCYKGFTWAPKYRKEYQKCLGEEGKDHLFRARMIYDIKAITEAVDVQDVEHLMSMSRIQVGARSQQNFPLLEEISFLKLPVMIKRGFGCTLEELYASCTYVENCDPWVCLRGLRHWDTSGFRFYPDLADIPIWKKHHPEIPVFMDCSHWIGTPAAMKMDENDIYYYTSTIAKGAKALGADGIYLDIHRNPGKAWTDPWQCLTFEQFRRLMDEI